MRRVGLAVVVGACSGQTALPIDPACNPLGANACLTPWPSSAFEIDDPATATGRRLALPDHPEWDAADGFSAAGPLVMSFPGGVSPEGLPPNDNFDRSLEADSPTVLLDMTTGERVAHFAEVDMQAAGMPDSQAMILRPAARLAGGHRYAVAITTAVHAPDGDDLPVPAGFAALRDHRHTDHELLEEMRPRFDDVLDALDEAGVPASDLVVAWDFTVASDASVRAELTAARDGVIAALDAHPPDVAMTTDRIGRDARTVTGTFEAPLEGGGTWPAPFTAVVPACATAHGPIVVYAGDAQAQVAAGLCMTTVATELRAAPADAQAILDHLALVRAMRALFGAQTAYFYGVERGAVFGATLLAYDPAIVRGVLAGGGANESTLLERSSAWPQARAQLAAPAGDPLDVQLALGFAQMRWDATAALPADKQVLVQAAIGDAEVPNLASYWLARSLALPVVGPTPFAPWGLTVQRGPLTGSALEILDAGGPPPPATNVPASGAGMRELARRPSPAAAAFLATGTVE